MFRKNKLFCIICKYTFIFKNNTNEKECLSNYNSEKSDENLENSDSYSQENNDYSNVSANIYYEETTTETYSNSSDEKNSDNEIFENNKTDENTNEITNGKTNEKEISEKQIIIDKTDNNIKTDIIIDVEPIILKKNAIQLKEELSQIINSTEVGKNYEIIGDDFVMKIKPTNLSSIPSSTHVDFSSCENIIRKHYNISEYRIITFLQIEIKNKMISL